MGSAGETWRVKRRMQGTIKQFALLWPIISTGRLGWCARLMGRGRGRAATWQYTPEGNYHSLIFGSPRKSPNTLPRAHTVRYTRPYAHTLSEEAGSTVQTQGCLFKGLAIPYLTDSRGVSATDNTTRYNVAHNSTVHSTEKQNNTFH